MTRFDDARRMRTTLKHPRALGKADESLYLAASFVHPDPRRPAHLMVEIFLISNSQSIRYRDAHDLTFLADGQALPFIGAAVNYRSASGVDGSISETTSVRVPYSVLLNLTRASKVNARLGATEVEVTTNHLEALRELASLMAPSSSEWTTQAEMEGK